MTQQELQCIICARLPISHLSLPFQVRQYDKDVETAVASALSYFDSYPRQPNASQVIVLDIDETALSNRAEWLNALEIRKSGVNVPFVKVRQFTPLSPGFVLCSS